MRPGQELLRYKVRCERVLKLPPAFLVLRQFQAGIRATLALCEDGAGDSHVNGNTLFASGRPCSPRCIHNVLRYRHSAAHFSYSSQTAETG